MCSYHGISGREYTREGDPLAHDDEGAFYAIENRRGCLLKLIRQRCISEARCVKLQLTIGATVDPVDVRHFTWPLDIVVNERDTAVGYVVSHMEEGEPLATIACREKSLPLCDRIAIARNLCALVLRLHENGIVLLSFDASDILVHEESFRVFLANNLSIEEFAHINECPIRTANRLYLPPELNQGTHSRLFFPQSDDYMLAVLAFFVLTGGRLPRTEADTFSIFDIAEYAGYQAKAAAIPVGTGFMLRKFFHEGYYNPAARPSAEDLLAALDRSALCLRARLSRAAKPTTAAGTSKEEDEMQANDVLLRISERAGRLAASARNSESFWAASAAFLLALALTGYAFALTQAALANFAFAGAAALLLGGAVGLLACAVPIAKRRIEHIFTPTDYLAAMGGVALGACAGVALCAALVVV